MLIVHTFLEKGRERIHIYEEANILRLGEGLSHEFDRLDSKADPAALEEELEPVIIFHFGPAAWNDGVDLKGRGQLLDKGFAKVFGGGLSICGGEAGKDQFYKV